MARPSLYETQIEPHLKEIRELLAQGIPKAQIAHKFGISESTFYKYQREIESFQETAKTGRERSVKRLEGTAFNAAMGYYVNVKKGMKVMRKEYDENGKLKCVNETVEPYEETVYVPPNAAILCFLLKNWGGYSNDPEAAKMRLNEFELKKAIAKENYFDLEV